MLLLSVLNKMMRKIEINGEKAIKWNWKYNLEDLGDNIYRFRRCQNYQKQNKEIV